MRLEKSKYKWLERGWRLTKPPVDKEVYRTLLYSYHMKIKTAHKVLHNLNKRQNWKFHKKLYKVLSNFVKPRACIPTILASHKIT